MSNLPFTQYGFQLYHTEDVEKLVAKKSICTGKTVAEKKNGYQVKTGDGPVKKKLYNINPKK